MVFLIEMTYVYLFIICGLAVLFFLVLAIILGVQRALERKNMEKMSKKLNVSSTYVIDIQNQKVRYFNLRYLKKQSKMSFVEFLNGFSSEDQNKVKNWILGLLEKPFNAEDNPEEYTYLCDAVVKSEKKKTHSKCIMSCYFINFDKKVLYLEYELLLDIPTEYATKTKNVRNKVYHQLGEVKKLYDENKFSKGFVADIQISKIPNKTSQYNDSAIMAHVTNAIYKIINVNTDYLSFTNKDNELFIVTNRSYSAYQLTRFTLALREEISEFLETKGFSEFYDFYIISSFVSELNDNFDNSYAKLQKYFALDRDEKRKYTIFTAEKDNKFDIEQNYKTEINRIIRNQLLDVTFRPIAHISKKRLVNTGYMSFVTPTNTVFTSVDEIIKLAKMYDQDKEIFSLIVRKIIPTFINEKDSNNQKLVIDITIDQINYAIRSIPHFVGISDTYLILCFKSKNLIDIENDEDIMKGIKNLKDKGYEIALYIESTDYVLKQSTYAMFNYFFFNPLFEASIKANSTHFLKAHQYLEKLVRFNRNIICVDVENMQGIELLVKSGIEYFSADVISEKSALLLPFDKKISKKLLSMNK